ncbi:MAG: NADH-quinone oxidoreductase subunit C [Phototrophicales bacterium]|nr:NADH-quinone oxidoreductase subunit C [Phototrophicales bacterium]
MSISPAIDPVEAVSKAFSTAVKGVDHFRDETTIIVDPAQLPAVVRFLRDTAGLIYNYLSDISAVDYWDEEGSYEDRMGRFGVSYHIYSLLYNRRLRVKVFLPEENPTAPTITEIFPAANWLEREAFDMMGITFSGHPNMKRILMPTDWDGHPHRRDYPLGYETIQFSFNIEEILKHKPFAKE